MEIRFKGSIEEFRAVFGHVAVVQDIQADADWDDSWDEPVEAESSDEIVSKEVEAKNTDLNVKSDEGNYWKDQMPPMPEDDDPYMDRPQMVLPTIHDDLRKEAWSRFVKMTAVWTENFGKYGEPQPNRSELMQEMGHGLYTIPVLIMAYEAKSLQRLVEKALIESGLPSDLDFADQIACNMVQVSHMGFPDLAGTYDYSTSWKRNNPWRTQ